MLMSVVVAGSTALLLTVSCLAEEAKIPFARGSKIEVQIARPSKVDRNQGGDFDNKTQVIEPKIKISNLTPQQGYIGYKALFLLLIDSVAERGVSKVVLQHSFDITVPPKQFMETEAGSTSATYDENGIKWGWKYGSWVIQVTDSKGDVVLTKSTSASLEKQADLIKSLKLNQSYNRQWKPCPEPRM